MSRSFFPQRRDPWDDALNNQHRRQQQQERNKDLSRQKKITKGNDHEETAMKRNREENESGASNEYVLNVAFFSFIIFTIIQAFFALKAHSKAMLGDSAAMAVDAFSYLLNMQAERLKNRSSSFKDVRKIRLWLEFAPPLLSVCVLVGVSGLVFTNAVRTILGDGKGDADEPNVVIMFSFSFANLFLDILNVTCFAKAKDFGYSASQFFTNLAQKFRKVLNCGTSKSDPLVSSPHCLGVRSQTDLIEFTNGGSSCSKNDEISNNGHDDDRKGNLNMCSAYMHVMADTLRSVGVLIAASISFMFENVSGEVADAMGAIIVSLIILLSLGPLLLGLWRTGKKIYTAHFGGTGKVMEDEENKKDFVLCENN